MATSSSHAAPAATTAVIASGTASNTSETIVGSHIFRIDGFSAIKDLGVGKCIKSSTFRVGGHDWFVECYPCGLNEGDAGRVYLNLCRQEEDDHHVEKVSAKYVFTPMKSLKDGYFKECYAWEIMAIFTDKERHPVPCKFIERKKLLSLLEDDCFHVRCVVFMEKFPAAPSPDLATETVAGSHLLTVDDCYFKTRRAFFIGEFIMSSKFRIGGHSWYMYFYPRGETNEGGDYIVDDDDDDVNAADDRVTASLILDDPGANDEVKVRLEVTLLTHAGQIISSTQDFSTFSMACGAYHYNFLVMMEHESSPLLQNGIKIRCDIAVVNGITATPDLRLGIGGDSQHVRGDVTFEVGGHLFAAHKCVLTTRCTAFMAEFCGPAAGKAGVTVLRIDNMEPRVFKALLQFIYTDTLPDVCDDDKVVMAQSLLVTADRYAMERLKLICADVLWSYMNDANTAVDVLELAVKHGCHRLKEKCKELLKGHLAKIAP